MPRAKRAIEIALKEARRLEAARIGTGHLLVGLMAVRDGMAVRMLRNLGVQAEAVREEVLAGLGLDCGPEV